MGLISPLWAQPTELKNPEFLEEYAQSRGFLLGRPVKPKLTRSGRLFFLRSPGDSRSQSLFEWKGGRSQLVLAPETLLRGQDEKLSPEEKARNERKRQLGTGLTDYILAPDQSQILLPLSGQLFLYRLTDKSSQKLPVQGSVLDPQWSPDGKRIAYIKGHDVYALDLATLRETPVTRGGSLEVTHGIAEFVAQEDMRRLSGYCWSPDSRHIAFQEADHRGVEIWHISDPLHPEVAPVRQYYPRPGRRNVKSRVGIVEVGKSKVTWVRWDPSEEYLASLRWGPKGPLTLQLQDRLQQRLRLVAVDPAKGTTRLLVEEKHACWVPLHQDAPIWLDDGRFIYYRQRGDRLALAVHDPVQARVATFLDESQDYDILEIVGYDKGRKAVLCRIDRKPGNPRLRWLPLESGQQPREVEMDGVQEASLASGQASLAVGQQSIQHFPRLLWTRDGEPEVQVDNLGQDPKLDLHLQFETVTVQGREFRTVLLRPADYRPDQRYPVILDVYGGPTKVQVAHNRRAWLMDQWLANQGFLVVAIDNRGTPGRGRAWETSVYGDFGQLPLLDQRTALVALAQNHPEIDLDRVGVWGWSFGGYLSAQAVLQQPDFFKAAIAGAPVTDWEDYDTHYTERYLGTPQSRPDAYKSSSLIPLARSLQRPLLLIHGSADDNVYFRNSLKLSDALFRAGQPHELLTLPGITHSFRADVQVTQQLWTRMVRFFQQHLGRPQTK